MLNSTQGTPKQRERLLQLIEAAGTIAMLANQLGISYMTVKKWKERGRVSKRGALLVEQHPELGQQFKAIELRPDIHE